MNLNDLGWSTHFAHVFDTLSLPAVQPARVVRQDKHRYLVQGDFGTRPAVPAGRLRRSEDEAERPAVGDWVALLLPETGDLAVIQAVLPRRSTFSRKAAGETTREQVIAANIDTLFIVMGLDGDFNVRRAERYAVQAWTSSAVPVLVLNKADLCPDVDARVREIEAGAPGVDVLAVSATGGTGLDALRRYTGPGRTVAFVGSSGVGKSTLVNYLTGDDRMRTHAVREHDSRGRHTTTHRELILLPGGGVLIDTPGMRELQLWAPAEALGDGFSEIEALAAGCKFRDCTHRNEPGCAVQAALGSGELDPARYRSYDKLRRELAYLARRQDEFGEHLERQRGRMFGRMIKDMKRYNPKR